MRRLAALLLAFFGMLPLVAETDTVFRIKVTMKGLSGDASYSSHLEIGYPPRPILVRRPGRWNGSPAPRPPAPWAWLPPGIPWRRGRRHCRQLRMLPCSLRAVPLST